MIIIYGSIKKWKKEDGNSLVQFVLVLPIVLIIVCLMLDLGEAVITKTNLQHLVGEIHKSAVLYEEAGVEQGVKYFSREHTLDSQINKLRNSDKKINNENLKIQLNWSPITPRTYESHYSTGYHRFIKHVNRTDIKYLTVEGVYKYKYKMKLTRMLVGDELELKEKYSGLVYAGGDGWDE